MYSSNKIVLLISHWTLCALHNEKLETMKYSTHFNIRQSCFVLNMPTKIHFSLVTGVRRKKQMCVSVTCAKARMSKTFVF